MQTTPLAKLPTHFDSLGKLAWLWMNSPLQVVWNMNAAARFLLPPIELAQFHLIERDGLPVAYCSWAWLSEQAELNYMRDPSALQLQDWQSGDRLWFADWVAPFAAQDSFALRSAMKTRFPNEVARAIRIKRTNTKGRVMEFKGPALDLGAAHQRLLAYYSSFLEAAQKTLPQKIVRPRVHTRSRDDVSQHEETMIN